ncbi:MAG: hypothetical protein EA369_07450 [Bradymonadales bacterium]|nr:MAG: hypothetical protein EA369_07450 [Bradymonadales bacterium]
MRLKSNRSQSKRFEAFELIHQQRQQAREDEVFQLNLNRAFEQGKKDFKKVESLISAWETLSEDHRLDLSLTEELLLLAYWRAKAKGTSKTLSLGDLYGVHIWVLVSLASQDRHSLSKRGELQTKSELSRRAFMGSEKLVERLQPERESFLEPSFAGIWDDLSLARVHFADCFDEMQVAFRSKNIDESFLFWRRVEMSLWLTSAVFLVGRAALYTSLGPIGWSLLAADLIASTAFLLKASHELEAHQTTGSVARVQNFREVFGSGGGAMEGFLWAHLSLGLGTLLVGSRSLRRLLSWQSQKSGLQGHSFRRLAAFQRLHYRKGLVRQAEWESFARGFQRANDTFDFIRTTGFLYQDVSRLMNEGELSVRDLLRRARRYNIYRKTVYQQIKSLSRLAAGGAYVAR